MYKGKLRKYASNNATVNESESAIESGGIRVGIALRVAVPDLLVFHPIRIGGR